MQSTEFKELVLNTVLKMLETTAWQAISMRNLAKKINYTPAAIYKHFENKDEILWELIRLGHARMNASVLGQLQFEQPFLPLMLQMASLHWDFAVQNPQLYSAIYLIPQPQPLEQDEQDEQVSAINQFVLFKISEQKPVSMEEAWELYSGAMCLIIGYSTRYLLNKSFGTAAEIKRRMLNNLERFIKGALT